MLVPMINDTCGELAALLKRFDYVELSKKLGVDETTVYRWQFKGVLPARVFLPDIARATGIALRKLQDARQADWLAKRSV
jgi:hypothetical protein